MVNTLQPGIQESNNPVPESIQGYISVQGSASPFKTAKPACLLNTAPYHATAAQREDVRHIIETNGLQVLAESPLGFAVAGPAPAYEEITGGRVVTRECMTPRTDGAQRSTTRLDIIGPRQPKPLGLGQAHPHAPNIDAVVLDKPRNLQITAATPSSNPPHGAGKFHLTPPDDIADALNATALHQLGIRGDNILVATPDTGHYPHPYFTQHGYHIQPPMTIVPATNPRQDPVGHGTGISANLFAVAPAVHFQPIRTAGLVGSKIGLIAGFTRAKSLNPAPRIIACSWVSPSTYPPAQGTDAPDTVILTEIRHAIESGIIVIFGSGNGQFGVEPQIPGVIAAGGVYKARNGTLTASDVASGYASPWFGGVTVPTVCGVMGMKPRSQYIMMPVQPGCVLDLTESAPTLAELGDGTTASDGWAIFSGTSVAAPQIAGIAALILSVKPNLTPAQVRQALIATAIDITTGKSAAPFNNPATPGPDLATGAGLANAKAAVEYAKTQF